MEVAHGRSHVAVAEQTLNGMDVDTGFKQMGGETVTQGVDAAGIGQTSRIAGSRIQHIPWDEFAVEYYHLELSGFDDLSEDLQEYVARAFVLMRLSAGQCCRRHRKG
jgi:hypothetical protein